MLVQLIRGNAADVLMDMPDESVDCCITSPPYWKKRRYEAGGIGNERKVDEYVHAVAEIMFEIKRVLKKTGSLWLNIADTYNNQKCMQLTPQRLALFLVDEQHWILRNDVIWAKTPGPDKADDRLTFSHEHLLHFVKDSWGYYYDDSVIRKGGVRIQGDTLDRCIKKIGTNQRMKQKEKRLCVEELRDIIGREAQFVMVLRGQRVAPGTKREIEIDRKGFYFMQYNPNGGKLPDVLHIPNRVGKRGRGPDNHCAAFPEELCEIPVLATCPPGGTVLDPMCGTGTAGVVARKYGRKFVGIDLSKDYLKYAAGRLK